MKTTDLIRQVLDLIDNVEQSQEPAIEVDIDVSPSEVSLAPAPKPAEDISRFKQIVDLMNNDATTYANEPDEKIASIDAVTTDAGGGVNGPKNPADIRADSLSMYPNFLAKSGL